MSEESTVSNEPEMINILPISPSEDYPLNHIDYRAPQIPVEQKPPRRTELRNLLKSKPSQWFLIRKFDYGEAVFTPDWIGSPFFSYIDWDDNDVPCLWARYKPAVDPSEEMSEAEQTLVRLNEAFFDAWAAKHPDHGIDKDKKIVSKGWITPMKTLVNKYGAEEVEACIDWLRDDNDFWLGTALSSPAGIKKHWMTITGQRKSSGPSRTPAEVRNAAALKERAARITAAREARAAR